MKKIFTLFAATLFAGSIFAASYVPTGLKTITENTTVYCTEITKAGDPATDWVVVPSYGTSGHKYVNTNGDTDGNPTGLIDNLASNDDNVAMIQIKADGNTYTGSKRVVLMHVKGISGLIAHGFAPNTNRGMAIGCDEYKDGLSTPTEVASVKRTNGGAFIVAKDGLDASKEYVLAFYAVTSDTRFYAVEFIAGAVDHSDATVTGITINGEALEGFDADTKEYNVELPYGTTELPVVAATTKNDAVLTYTQATELPGSAKVKCTSFDESKFVEYTINFTVKATGSNDATLKALTVNGVAIAGFAADKYEYELGEFGVYEAVIVEATANEEHAEVEVAATEEEKKIVVSVLAEDKTTTLTYTLTYTRAAATELVAISDTTVWDWSKAGGKTSEYSDITLPRRDEEFNFADVLTNPDASFKAASLAGMAQYANGGGYAQGHYVRFVTTVAGDIVVEFSNTGTSSRPDRVLLVNEVETEYKSNTSASHVTTGKIAVAAGEVKLEALEMKDTPVKNMIRFYKVTFNPEKKTPTAIDNTEAGVKAVKVIRDGQMLIEKGGKVYNAQGIEVK